MKRALALLFVVLCLSATTASADYFGPPGWDNDPYFTHQSWDFPTAMPLGVPYSPNAGYVNPNGMPLATQVVGTWQDDLGSGRQGGWLFGGGTATVLASIYVPNIPDPSLLKELWFQATVKTNSVENFWLAVAVYDNNGNPFTLTDLTSTPVPDQPDWTYVTGRYWIQPQPLWEAVVLTGSLSSNEYLIIDQIDVDTHCIPEPSTIAMLLGAGLLGWIGWRRRK